MVRSELSPGMAKALTGGLDIVTTATPSRPTSMATPILAMIGGAGQSSSSGDGRRARADSPEPISFPPERRGAPTRPSPAWNWRGEMQGSRGEENRALIQLAR